MVMMVVVVMVMMSVAAGYDDHAPMIAVMMVMVMHLRHLYAIHIFDGRSVGTVCIVGDERSDCIRNGS